MIKSLKKWFFGDLDEFSDRKLLSKPCADIAYLRSPNIPQSKKLKSLRIYGDDDVVRANCAPTDGEYCYFDIWIHCDGDDWTVYVKMDNGKWVKKRKD